MKHEKCIKPKRPKGITIIAFFNLLFALVAIYELFAGDPHIFLGFIVRGFSARISYAIGAVMCFLVAIGLLKLKKIAWQFTFISGIIGVVSFLIEIIRASEERMIEILGEVANAELLIGPVDIICRVFFGVPVVISIILLVYLYKQKNKFIY